MRNYCPAAALLGTALALAATPALAQRSPLAGSQPVASPPPATATNTGRTDTAAPAAPAVVPAAPVAQPVAAPPPAPAAQLVAASQPVPAAPAAQPVAAPPVIQQPVRIRDLNAQMQALTEQIDGTKQSLSGTAAALLAQNGATRAVISHVNEMSDAFHLQRVSYALDGVVVLTRTDDGGALADQHELPVYDGLVTPGAHTLTVTAEYRGRGLGLFQYADGYVFRVRSTETFTARAGSAINVRVVGYERAQATSLEDRPAVRFVEQLGPVNANSDDAGGSTASERPR